MNRVKLSHMMDDETWFNAKKAVELGFADRVLFDADDEEDSKKKKPEKPKEEENGEEEENENDGEDRDDEKKKKLPFRQDPSCGTVLPCSCLFFVHRHLRLIPLPRLTY